MTDYPQYPAGESPEPPPGPATLGPQPRSVDLAVKLIWAAIALTVLSTIVAFVQLDEAVDAALESDTTGTLTEDAARTATIAFIILFLVIGVGLYALLALFINKGKNWARIVYTVLAAIFLLLWVFGLTAEQSAISLIVTVVQIALVAATLYFLWQKDSNAWFSRSA